MPEFSVHSNDILIKFTCPEDRIVRVSDKVNDKVNNKVNNKVNDLSNTQKTELINYLLQNPYFTITDLADLIGVSRKTVAKYIKELKNLNVIERIDSNRKGYWRINS